MSVPENSADSHDDSRVDALEASGVDSVSGATKASPVWNELLRQLTTAWPADRWSNVGVVVGCSGGADSVGLLRALHHIAQQLPSARGFLVAAHFHHGIRGEQADLDAALVHELAGEIGIRVVQEDGDGQSTDESTLRDQRQGFLRRVAQSTGARYITLAHSLDDNVETVLHHLMRGTGPAGLAGIAPSRLVGPDPIGQDLVIVRPLLSVRRQSIRDALTEIGQRWREDSSNADTKYRRNWIRHELIPLIQTQYPKATEAIGRAIDSQSEWRRTIESISSGWLAGNLLAEAPLTIRRSRDHDDSIVISSLQALWQRRDWSRRDMSQEHWRRIAETVRGGDDERYSLPGDIDVVAFGTTITISKPIDRARKKLE